MWIVTREAGADELIEPNLTRTFRSQGSSYRERGAQLCVATVTDEYAHEDSQFEECFVAGSP